VTASLSEPGELSPADRKRAIELAVELRPPPTAMELVLGGEGKVVACEVTWPDDKQTFDSFYPVLGADAKAGLAIALGAQVDECGELLVDSHMQTSVPNLYAAGDVVSTLNQISVAVGHAAVAATAIHHRLAANPL
jgi:thioredoxin reductase (NADPH)